MTPEKKAPGKQLPEIKTPETITPEKTISLTFKAQEGYESPPVKVSTTTKLAEIFDAYSKSRNIPYGVLRFGIDGQRLDRNDTPMQANLIDEDEISVFQETYGG